MKVVVDASVAIKWVVDESGSQLARKLAERSLLSTELLLVECANALWRRVRTGELTPEDAAERLAELRKGPVTLSAMALDIAEAFRLSVQLRHPVYDCVYLACALRNGCELVTADGRFIAALTNHPALFDRVRLLI